MPDKELLIETGWLLYREQVIPAEAGAIQLTECRRAFYAGALSLFTTIMNILEPGADATEGDLTTLTLIQAELKRFNAQVLAGVR
jgi:hypothetical protein